MSIALADDVLDLVREDLRDFAGYRSARNEKSTGSIWLNANEAARANIADTTGGLRRYPQPQPERLRAALCALYGCAEERLLIGRGSDEAIDLLVRAFCRPGKDAVLVAPPVFGMYAVSARLQGARLLEVPLRDGDDDFSVDLDEVARVALGHGAKLVFLCSPGNPAGGILSADAVLDLARRLRGRALVVVDEAYLEFADQPSLVDQAASQANIAILRTLSKAHALAAARIGCAIADPRVIDVLRRCQAPYPVPSPCAEQAYSALATAALARTRITVAGIRSERERMREALAELPAVRRVYPSQANFLLVRFAQAGPTFACLLQAGIVVRDMRAMPQLGDALRISIGTPVQNDLVLTTLQTLAVAA
jgi:histidinol-phosphate aminotransferase